LKELGSSAKVPLKTVSQSAVIQQSFENVEDIYNILSRDSPEKFKFTKEIEIKNLRENVNRQVVQNQLDVVKYYPIQYLYKKGGLFAFRKVTAIKRIYIQGYMINLVYLTDNILRGFISKNTPDNFSIYSYPLNDKTPYASASISDKLDFIKLYVYKNDNSYIDSIIKEETIKYYVITFVLFTIILVGCTFIYKTIKSEAQINQKKGDFISAVTHELKTPLTSIRLYSEMLFDDMVKEEQKKKVYYEYMLKESERLTRLINNVLDFSKIENNKKVFQMEKGGLNELLIELCEKYKNNLKVAGFEFSYEINDIKDVSFDKDAITQVFINLLDNAVKYSSASDEKKIDVRLYEAQDKIIFEVVDKGIGIPKSEQKAIFEKFHRIENELTRTSKGSGIGLSIVKAYIKAHGGKIEVFSKEKEGSRFRITLPGVQKA
jgi:signal transduction histidine kinase